jgi:hypothetical protein
MALRKIILMGVAAAGFGAGALALSTTAAAAYVACNREGDCWHTDRREHAPGVRFEYHPDDWYFHRHWESDHDHHWREYHEGRGYWRNGVWITL